MSRCKKVIFEILTSLSSSTTRFDNKVFGQKLYQTLVVGSNRVFARRSKLKAKKRIEDLQQESLELETELDDHEESCDEIWAEKLVYEHEVEELIQKREHYRKNLIITV